MITAVKTYNVYMVNGLAVGSILCDKNPPQDELDGSDALPTQVIEAINRVNTYMESNHPADWDGDRTGWCGFASELMARALNNIGAEAKVYNIWALQLAAFGVTEYALEVRRKIKSAEYPWHPIVLQSQIHTCSLFRFGGKIYLGDLTVGQFDDRDTGTVSNLVPLVNVRSGSPRIDSLICPSKSHVFMELMRTGVIELTPQNLREYLMLTSDAPYHVFIDESPDAEVVFNNALVAEQSYDPGYLDRCLGYNQ